jgi:glyoxylase-like metal-dependent hydrolase (beta-lactamase superfamily II)
MKGFPASAPALRATAHAAAACSHQLEFAPLPSTSRGTSSNTASYAVQSFGGGAYIVTDGSYQNVFFVSTTGVIHVGLPPTIGKNMLFAIGKVTSQPITHIVYSRPQADHIGVASLVAGPGKPVEVIAREDTKEPLQEAPDASRPLPTVTFKDDYKFCVGQPDAGAALRRREPRPR